MQHESRPTATRTHNRSAVPARVHVFDMDGTLLLSSATVVISHSLGYGARGDEIEAAWAAGQITDEAFWHNALEMWSGATDAQIDAAFEAATWMEGVAEVLTDIAARGERSVVISQSPHFFVKRLERWGAHATHGSKVELGKDFVGNPTLSVADKVSITRRLLSDWAVPKAGCVAYGDSASDVQLFQWLDNTVGVNPKEPIRQLARAVYDGSDMRGAYEMARKFIDD